MKRKKVLIYFLSGFIPVLIFFICALLNGYLPFGQSQINIYDSFTQYPGMLLEYKNLLKTGNIFYSWNAGLGFNFFGTLTYYAASPLNLLCIFADTVNYPFFIAAMTYLRFFLLGISMCFYLCHKKDNIKPVLIVLFSVAYSLMGYTSVYYYNFLWIDSVIMLPLIIHGLDKILENKKANFYLITLAITILINYYIGYMICIFCLIYFIYKIITIKDKKTIIKKFIISSLLAGLIGAIVILPSYFALKTGKAELFETVKYTGVSRNITSFFYTFITGAYQPTDQSYGPAQIYCSLLVAVLTVFYFFNTKYSKKEKIATGLVILFFYLSFSVNALNFAWHFFQKPIWWQSRFAFVFSFFLLNLGIDTLMNIDKTKFKNKYRIIISILFILAVIFGAYFKWQVLAKVEMYTYVYIFLSFMLFIEIMFLIDKKYFLPMIIVFTFIDISINCFNNLKCNKKYTSYIHYTYLKEGLPKTIEKLNEENDSFYRFELMDDFTSNDGLYFNFHGINYFNSVRNIRVTNLMEKLGLLVSDKCHIFLNIFDPTFLSLFNFKYLYGNDMAYFKKLENRLYENPYPLSLGFIVNEKVKNTKLDNEDYRINMENLLSNMMNEKVKLYKKIDYTHFKLDNLYINAKDKIKFSSSKKRGTMTYSFTSDDRYLFMPYKDALNLFINDEEIDYKNFFIEINKGDKVKVEFIINGEIDAEKVFMHLFDLDEYERIMTKLSTNLLKAKEYKNGHILEGTIEVPENNTYLYTSIEWEDGMKVYVDGKETKYDVILDALIGLELEPGKHTIYVDYIPKGFIPGAIISSISLVVAGFYLQKNKKNL